MDTLADKLAGTHIGPVDDGALPGLEDAYRSLLEVVSYPILHSDKFKHLNIEPPKGVLLYGPPGVGKTHLVRSIATSTNATLTTIHGPEILTPFLGDSERLLREKFSTALHTQQNGRPAIVFIDEIDSIAPHRQQNAGMEARMVAQLLTLMDGLKGRGRLVVIGATNRPNALDPALRRPGRFDREISIDVPNQIARAKILHHYLQAMPIENIDIAGLAESTNGYVGADLSALCREAAMQAIRTKGKGKVTQRDFAMAMRHVQPSTTRGVGIDVAETTWTDVGGLKDTKLKLIQAVQWPLEHSQVMHRLGVTPPRGILMYGPPGCSKTTLVKIIATQTKATFLSVNGAQLYSPYVGDAEKTVRELFKRARAASPSVIFFDEIEAIVGKRMFETNAKGDSVQERILSTMLNEMDGVEVTSNVLVIGATNRIDMVDAALLRPGRFDRIIYVPPPDRAARKEILEIRARRMPLNAAVDFDVLADLTQGFSGADLANLSREAAMIALRENIDESRVSMEHFDRAMKAVQPSLKADLMEYYGRMQREFG
ncbi:hypothetical protein EC988_001289 [Linderina pennispora]|nr:hypothetical protein EC988_001289 [Linderina pennispora]